MTLLMVDLQRPEVDIGPIPKLGRNAVVSCEVRYDGLRVPLGRRVGEEGLDFRYLLDGLNPERILIASEALGLGRAPMAKMNQHDATLQSKGHGFVVDQEVMTIGEGDLVLWACADPTAHAFEVRGDQAFFGSAALTNECGYSHAFGTPGEHRWADALGGPAEGVVRVKDVRCASPAELTTWRKRLTRGTVVMISDGKVEPAEVDVVVGQRVCFAVVTTSPMTITDTALIGACQRS